MIEPKYGSNRKIFIFKKLRTINSSQLFVFKFINNKTRIQYFSICYVLKTLF